MSLITVRRTCPLCDKPSSVTVDEDRYERWLEGRRSREPVGVSGVQVLFPDLSPADREILISGSHDECFNRAFAEED